MRLLRYIKMLYKKLFKKPDVDALYDNCIEVISDSMYIAMQEYVDTYINTFSKEWNIMGYTIIPYTEEALLDDSAQLLLRDIKDKNIFNLPDELIKDKEFYLDIITKFNDKYKDININPDCADTIFQRWTLIGYHYGV